MSYPITRPRRLRKNAVIRSMVRESALSVGDLIYPMFITHGKGIREEIEALPENYHLSLDRLIDEVKTVWDLGIPAVLLFGIPEGRDDLASEAYNPKGIVQNAVRLIKKAVPGMVVITDVCLCEYTSHGHCGIIEDGYLQNDRSVELLQKVTLSHAEAGSLSFGQLLPRKAWPHPRLSSVVSR